MHVMSAPTCLEAKEISSAMNDMMILRNNLVGFVIKCEMRPTISIFDKINVKLIVEWTKSLKYLFLRKYCLISCVERINDI